MPAQGNEWQIALHHLSELVPGQNPLVASEIGLAVARLRLLQEASELTLTAAMRRKAAVDTQACLRRKNSPYRDANDHAGSGDNL